MGLQLCIMFRYHGHMMGLMGYTDINPTFFHSAEVYGPASPRLVSKWYVTHAKKKTMDQYDDMTSVYHV